MQAGERSDPTSSRDTPSLNPQELEALSGGSPLLRVRAGEPVIGEGTRPQCAFVVRKGRIRLSRELAGRRVTLLILRPGDVLGDVPLFLGSPAWFDAVAVTDATLVRVPADRLFAALNGGSTFATRWVTDLAGRIALWQARVEELLAGGSQAQVVALLLREARGSTTVELTQNAIAELLGVSRTHVNRMLRELEARGAIRIGYRRILINDVGALRSFVRLATRASEPALAPQDLEPKGAA